MAQQVLTITQINEYIRNLMDSDGILRCIAVRGEISNYKVYPSGHHYFTLKDDTAALKCVMFRGNAARLRFRPDNGMQIIAMGNISVYPRDGAYQLYCSALVPDGVGDLYTAFEQLKNKLAAEGLFAQDHKKQLPKYPNMIGIVTSSAGAAIHDMLRILNKRYPLCKVRLFPVRVQGIEAPGEIVSAIQYANRFQLADLLIVGRGGGSIEDLWAFNDESVARAIYESEIPVVSAVGHEPDVTISDYVADLRAATPSNAAELTVPDQNTLRQHIDSLFSVMGNIVQRELRASQQQLKLLASSSMLQSPDAILQLKTNKLEQVSNRLFAAHNQNVNVCRQHFVTAAAKLDALSPLKVLSRGYAVVQDSHGSVVYSAKQLESGAKISVILNDGSVSATVTDREEKVV